MDENGNDKFSRRKSIATITVTWISLLVIAAVVMFPPTITAFAAYRQGQNMAVKLEQVHVQTNSNLTALKADLESANQQIKSLQTLVATMVEERKALQEKPR
jgi:predicted PurR-regulated permease PerM